MQSLSHQRVASFRPRVAAQRPQIALAKPSTRNVSAQAALARWEDMFKYLSENQPESMSPEDAQEKIAAGSYVLVDVRPEPSFEKAHIEGAINVPLYKSLSPTNSGVGGFIKFIAYSANGVTPIELNEAFIEGIKKASEGGKKGLIFACEAGGTLRPSTNFSCGKASRSFQALYRALTEAQISDSWHLDRGLYGWYQSDLPFSGDYTPDIGRTPSAASDPTLKVAVASGGYQIRPEDKK